MGKSVAETQLDQKHQSLPPSKTTEPIAKPSFKNHYLSSRRKRLASVSQTLSNEMEEEEHHSQKEVRVPLSEVVSDCVRRWFTDTLKEAKAGDINMQVLVGQMYFNGYGVSKDAQKVSSFSLLSILNPQFAFLIFAI